MTDKAKVRQVYRGAHAKRYHTNGGEGYTLIWGKPGENIRLSSGATAREAWKKAAQNLHL